MSKFTAIAAITLDGKIAKNSHEFSFNWTSKEDQLNFKRELKKFDAVIVGSSTFKTAAEPLKKRNTIVLTSKVKTTKEKYPHVWFCNYKTIDLKTFLSSLSFKKIAILGGSHVYTYCLEKNLIDELILTIEPIVFGQGINLFVQPIPPPPGEGRGGGFKIQASKFTLTSIKKLNKQGTLLLKYSKMKSAHLSRST
jgi:dihydrofolate reductase